MEVRMNLGVIAKALTPPFVALLSAIAAWAESGAFDVTETAITLGGAVTGLLVYIVPNSPASTVARHLRQ
jgi:hypothetical protein